jgi:hypothetical protein
MGQPAPLAQSAEHSHGKAGVGGSIPPGGSRSRLRSACRGGVAQGQSKRLIIAVSVVRVHPPLPDGVRGGPPAIRGCGASSVGRGRRAVSARPRRPVWDRVSRLDATGRVRWPGPCELHRTQEDRRGRRSGETGAARSPAGAPFAHPNLEWASGPPHAKVPQACSPSEARARERTSW